MGPRRAPADGCVGIGEGDVDWVDIAAGVIIRSRAVSLVDVAPPRGRMELTPVLVGGGLSRRR